MTKKQRTKTNKLNKQARGHVKRSHAGVHQNSVSLSGGGSIKRYDESKSYMTAARRLGRVVTIVHETTPTPPPPPTPPSNTS